MPLHPIIDNFIVGNASAGVQTIMRGFVRAKGAAAPGDATLLAGETDGLAIDWTATGDFALPTWAMQAVQERASSVDTLQSPHVFFTQLGTSPKYVKNSATTIGWSPHNSILQSQTFDSASWDKFNSLVTVTANTQTAPDGTMTADSLTTAATSGCYLRQAFTVVAGLVYAVSCYVKDGGTNDHISLHISDFTANALTQYFNISSGTVGTSSPAGTGSSAKTATIESVGSGWYRCTMFATFSANNSSTLMVISPCNADNTANANNAQDTYIWGAQINRGYFPTAYISTVAAARVGLPISYAEGLLCEPAATNLLVQSQTLGTTWDGSLVDLTNNAIAAPDGSTTAEHVAADTTPGTNHFLRMSSLTVTNAAHTLSIYAKKNAYEWVDLLIANNAGYSKYVEIAFNVDAGTVGTTRNGTYTATGSIESIGNDWYRCKVVTSALDANSTHKVEISVATADNFGTGHTGNGTDGLYLWGAQLELGSAATSYVPTVAASTTRAVDAIFATTASFNYGAANTVYMSLTLRDVVEQFITFLSFDDDLATIFESIFFYLWLDGSIYPYMEDGGFPQVDYDSTQDATVNTPLQVSASWATNDFDLSIDGVTATTDGTCTMPTVTHMRIGGDRTTTQPCNGFIKKFVIVPRQVQTDDGNLETWRYL